MNIIEETTKTLQHRTFDPFSPKCEIEKIREQFHSISRKIAAAQDKEEKQQWITALDMYVLADTMYEMAKSFHTFLDQTVLHANFTYEELLHIAVSDYNRRYRNSTIWQLEQIKKRKVGGPMMYHEIHNFQMESEPGGELSNAQQTLDAITDSLAVFLKYLSNHENTNFSKDVTVRQTTSLRKLPDYNYTSQIYCTQKYVYDLVRWKNGKVEIDRSKYPYKISVSFSEDELKHEEANRKLLEVEVYNEKLKIDRYQLLFSLVGPQFTKKLKSLRCENGYVIPELENVFDRELEGYVASQYAFFRVCYPFADKLKLPAFPELTMEKCLAIYIALNQLMTHLSVLPVEQKDDLWENIYQIPFRFEKRVLIDYLVEKTGFGKNVIEQFLTLYGTDTLKNISIWNTPLLSYKEDYIFFLYAAINGVTINLMDCWLEKAGFDLDKRGPVFEDFVRKFLSQGIGQSKEYPCHLYPQKNFNHAKTKSEQIDLIFKAGNKLFVCEAKCIRYPMEPIKQSRTLTRLTEGCHQARKKADFIRNHISQFESVLGDISGLEIIPLVITNYVVYSGFVRNGVQIVDIKRLVSYIYPHTYKVKILHNGKEESVVEYPKYTNQEEFNQNMLPYLQLPPDVKMILNDIEVETQRMGVDAGSYDLYWMNASVKNKN